MNETLGLRPLQALSGVQTAIDEGSFSQQLAAIAFLRLTPVAPFR